VERGTKTYDSACRLMQHSPSRRCSEQLATPSTGVGPENRQPQWYWLNYFTSHIHYSLRLADVNPPLCGWGPRTEFQYHAERH
jgi:hypothetical protein